jgi:hemoglobin
MLECLLIMNASSPTPSLFDRIGGSKTIDALVPAFYARVLADPDLAPFFKKTSIEALHHMQREFFSMALGGPVEYTGRSLAHVHHGRGITASHFNLFAGHLLETLSAIGVSRQEADEVIAHIDTFANEITGTSY